MVDHPVNEAVRLDAVFRALGDSTRRAMLRLLTDGDRSIGQLAAPFAMTFAGASKHVKVLESAGLVRRRVLGRTHVCQLAPKPLVEADEWLQFYRALWNRRLDAFEQQLCPPTDPGQQHLT